LTFILCDGLILLYICALEVRFDDDLMMMMMMMIDDDDDDDD